MLPFRALKYIILLCLLPFSLKAQIYYNVTATSGSQVLNGNTVSIVDIGTPTVGTICGVGPYYVQTGGYRYVFSSTIYKVRLHIFGINPDDTVKINVNAVHYIISPSEISNYTTCNTGPLNAYILNGNIVGVGSLSTNGVEFDAYVISGIDSIDVYQSNSGSGWIYDFWYGGSCPGNIVASSSPDTACVGNNLNLIAAGTSLSPTVSFAWSGPGYSSTSQNPSISNISASAGGTYIVNAYDTGGCVYTSSEYITVMSIPSATSVSSNSPVCTGDSLHLYASAAEAEAYSWSGPGGFSMPVQNPSEGLFALSDTGYYVLNVTNVCGSVSDSTHVVSKNPVIQSLNYSSPACTGQNLNLSVSTSSSNVSYQWSGPGFSSANQNTSRPNMAFSDSGSYTISLSSAGCTTTDTFDVPVLQSPAIPQAGSNSPICVGDSLGLYASDASSGISYSWSGPGSFNSLSQDPYILFAATNNTGLYTVTVSLNGCTESANTSVTVNPILGPPAVSISVNPGDTLCAGNPSASFSASASNAGSASYQWKLNGVNISGASSATYTGSVSNGDLISCEVMSNLPCQPTDSAISNHIHMTVISVAPPTLSLSVATAGNALVFTGNASGNLNGVSYKWQKNGVFIAGQNTITYSSSNLQPGDSICLILYTPEHCANPDSVIACYQVPTGIVNLQSNFGDIHIYPNPVSNELIIEGAEKGYAFVLRDITGREVYKGMMKEEKEIINTHELSPGNYLLEISKENGERMIKKISK